MPEPFDLEGHMAMVARELHRRAVVAGPVDGHLNARFRQVIDFCHYDDDVTMTRLIFTRDVGHHTSGWLKNPDYERCLHLSCSPFPEFIISTRRAADPTLKTWRRWAKAFFGDAARYLWAESPKSDTGKRLGVWHFRVFCNEAWEPHLPRGEVYSREFTEAGWRSASQIWEEDRVDVGSTVDPN